MTHIDPSQDNTATADLARRFGGLDRLYGLSGADRIRASHVVVIGLGGVGSWAAESLARSDIGQLTLIDMDHVSESNLNRQIQATEDSIGMAKVLAMQNRIRTYNPRIRIECIDEFVTPDNCHALIPESAHAIIDACDQVSAKVAIAQHCRDNKKLLVCAGAAGGKRLAHEARMEDLLSVTHDPLLASLRNRLRRLRCVPRDAKRAGVMCVFSREPVRQSPDQCAAPYSDSSLNCHGYGSVVTVTATFGHCAAGWVLDKLAAG